MPLTDLDYMALQLEALFTYDSDGRMRRVNEPDGEVAPRFFFGATKQGNLWRFRYDLPQPTLRRLNLLAASEPPAQDLRARPANFDVFAETLEQDAPVESRDWGPAYRFPEIIPTAPEAVIITPSNIELLRVIAPDLDYSPANHQFHQPCTVVIDGGVAVSMCFCARKTARAAEAGVETLPEYRGRGYAPTVVAAWAHAIRAQNLIPLYSTSWDNLASQAVAHKLGLIQYGSDLSFR